MDTYLTIQTNSEGTYKEKGSKFISYAYHVTNEKEIKDLLQILQRKYYDARHICYAYVLDSDGTTYRINDNGEPSGTAGRPIWGVIRSHNLTYVLIVVVRYFGGIKLGTSGLINAYRKAAEDAVCNAIIKENIVQAYYSCRFTFEQINTVLNLLKKMNAHIINQQFQVQCILHFSVRKDNAKLLFDKLQKTESIKIEFLYEK